MHGYDQYTFGTLDPVLEEQAISFITRTWVDHGYWQQQPDDPATYPNVAASTGHRADVTTYARYVGPLPDTSDRTQDFPNWDQPAPRGWCARTLWQGIRNDLFRMPPFTIPFFAPTDLTFASRYIEFVGGLPQVQCDVAPNAPPQPF